MAEMTDEFMRMMELSQQGSAIAMDKLCIVDTGQMASAICPS